MSRFLFALAIAVLLVFLGAQSAEAQTKVKVSDTVYNADGTLASGGMDISWPAFTTADNYTIAKGILTLKIVSGVVSVDLVPTQGASPAGVSYTVNYSLQNKISYTEYWTIPSTGPVTISQIRTTPAPTPTVTFGEQQLTLGTGMSVPVGFWRRSAAPTATAAGQCYWDAANDRLMCSNAGLSFNPPPSGPPSGAAGGDLSGTYPNPKISPGVANQVMKTSAAGTAREWSTLSTGTAGADFQVSFAPGAITLNLPDASATARGAMTTGTQTLTGDKTLTGALGVGSIASGAKFSSQESGAKTATDYSTYLSNMATSSTASVNKYGAYISSTGTWNGAGSSNIALGIADVVGGTVNYAIKTGLGTVDFGDTVFTSGNRTAASLGDGTAGFEEASVITGSSWIQGVGIYTEYDTSAQGGNFSVLDMAPLLGGSGAINYFGINLRLLGTGATDAYGLKIANVTAGVNNWAIKTGLGKVEFGDIVSAPEVNVKAGNTIRYADQFPGAGGGAKIGAAVADINTSSGVVFAVPGMGSGEPTLYSNKVGIFDFRQATNVLSNSTTDNDRTPMLFLDQQLGDFTTVPLTGTVTLTNGSTTVTGTGTSFLSQLNGFGRSLKLNTDATTAWAEVSSIADDTHATLMVTYPGAGGSGPASYLITQLGFAIRNVVTAGTANTLGAGETIGFTAISKRTGGSRGLFGANFNVSYQTAASTTQGQAIGLEIDLSNQSGVDDNPPINTFGLLVLSAGTNHSNTGIFVNATIPFGAGNNAWRRSAHLTGWTETGLLLQGPQDHIRMFTGVAANSNPAIGGRDSTDSSYIWSINNDGSANFGGNVTLNKADLKFTGESAPGAPTATLVAAGTGNCTAGAHKFKITFVTANGETQLGTASGSVACDGTHKQVSLTSIPLGTTGVVTGRNVCATRAEGTAYYLAASSPVINDNTTMNYTFDTADASLTAACNQNNTTGGSFFLNGDRELVLGLTSAGPTPFWLLHNPGVSIPFIPGFNIGGGAPTNYAGVSSASNDGGLYVFAFTSSASVNSPFYLDATAADNAASALGFFYLNASKSNGSGQIVIAPTDVHTCWDNFYSGTCLATILGDGSFVSAGTVAAGKNLYAALVAVTFSATPAFDASAGNSFKITLTENVTSSTLSGPAAGQVVSFLICQDGTGNRTFTWPTNVLGGMTIGAAASKCSAQNFLYDGTNAYALSTGIINM